MRKISKLLLFFPLILMSFNLYSQTVDVKASEVKVVFAGKKYYLHEIKKGETLYSICRFYKVELPELLDLNKKNQAIVKLGEVLRIPDNGQVLGSGNQKKKDKLFFENHVDNKEFFLHTVKQGDSLFSISDLYDISMSSIINLNPGLKIKMSAGQEIKIPNSVIEDLIYTVSKHDNKESVLALFKINYEQLLEDNSHIRKSRLFKRGTDLIIRQVKVVKPVILKNNDLELTQDAVIKDSVIYEESYEETSDSVNISTYLPDAVLLSPIKKTLNIAVLLPLYLDKNDELNNISDLDDRTLVSNKLYHKSKMFIRFYQGLLMSIDELIKKGVSINLHVFDTQRSVGRVASIITENNLEDVDFIIGPVYSDTFEKAAELLMGKQIPLISPLSNRVKSLESNNYVFQMNTSLDALCEHLADYMTLDLDNKNIVVIQKDTTVLNANKLIEGIEYHLFEKGSRWDKNNLSYKKISIDEHGLYGIERTLCDSCENIIILPSTNRPIVENVIRNLNVLSKRYKIKLIGFSLWLKFSSMDPYVLFNLNTSIFSSRYIDYKSTSVDTFVDKFREKYNAEPNDYSFRAYDICNYFSSLARRYGKSYVNSNFDFKEDQLQSNFKLERVNPLGGYENVGLLKISYKDNFTIEIEKINL